MLHLLPLLTAGQRLPRRYICGRRSQPTIGAREVAPPIPRTAH
nr:MAG TPA: hypothetical protein [Caudoviricetes sp.]